MAGKTFLRIKELIDVHSTVNLPVPESIGISVDTAWLLMEEVHDSRICLDPDDKLRDILMIRDKGMMLAYFKNARIYGVKVIVADVVLI